MIMNHTHPSHLLIFLITWIGLYMIYVNIHPLLGVYDISIYHVSYRCLQIHYLMQAARSLPSLPALAVTLHQSQTNPRMFARPCSKFLHCNISTFHDVDVLDSGGFSIHYPSLSHGKCLGSASHLRYPAWGCCPWPCWPRWPCGASWMQAGHSGHQKGGNINSISPKLMITYGHIGHT